MNDTMIIDFEAARLKAKRVKAASFMARVLFVLEFVGIAK